MTSYSERRRLWSPDSPVRPRRPQPYLSPRDSVISVFIVLYLSFLSLSHTTYYHHPTTFLISHASMLPRFSPSPVGERHLVVDVNSTRDELFLLVDASIFPASSSSWPSASLFVSFRHRWISYHYPDQRHSHSHMWLLLLHGWVHRTHQPLNQHL